MACDCIDSTTMAACTPKNKLCQQVDDSMGSLLASSTLQCLANCIGKGHTTKRVKVFKLFFIDWALVYFSVCLVLPKTGSHGNHLYSIMYGREDFWRHTGRKLVGLPPPSIICTRLKGYLFKWVTLLQHNTSHCLLILHVATNQFFTVLGLL